MNEKKVIPDPLSDDQIVDRMKEGIGPAKQRKFPHLYSWILRGVEGDRHVLAGFDRETSPREKEEFKFFVHKIEGTLMVTFEECEMPFVSPWKFAKGS